MFIFCRHERLNAAGSLYSVSIILAGLALFLSDAVVKNSFAHVVAVGI